MTASRRITVVTSKLGPVSLSLHGNVVSLRTRAGKVIVFPPDLSGALRRKYFGATTQSLSMRAQGQPIKRKKATT